MSNAIRSGDGSCTACIVRVELPIPMLSDHRFILGSLLAASIAVSSCTGGEGDRPRAAGGHRPRFPSPSPRSSRRTCRSRSALIGDDGGVLPPSLCARRSPASSPRSTSSRATTSRPGQVLFTLGSASPRSGAPPGGGEPRSATPRRRPRPRSRRSACRTWPSAASATREQVGQIGAHAAAALEATVAADSAAVENAKVQLQYATIRAPIAGRTGVADGDRPAISCAPTIRRRSSSSTRSRRFYVSFARPEPMLPELQALHGEGRRSASKPRRPTTTAPPAVGQITFVDNAVDQTTGTIKIKATFPNHDRRLWPGQFVNVIVRLATDPRGARGAVHRRPDRARRAVRLRGEARIKTVEMRTVTIARTAGAETVIKDGRQAAARPW